MILCADVLDGLAALPSGLARCCVTSPPYWGLRDYGVPGQIGLERTPDEYVARLVAVFREVRRVLADDGTLWLVIGDSYASGPSGAIKSSGLLGSQSGQSAFRQATQHKTIPQCMKPKDLGGIPWLLAFALRVDGWWLRSEIIWSKRAPMPESVRDRPTRAHEQVFLFAKSARYFYDSDAVREPLAGNFPPNHPRTIFDNSRPAGALPPGTPPDKGLRRYGNGNTFPWEDDGNGRNVPSAVNRHQVEQWIAYKLGARGWMYTNNPLADRDLEAIGEPRITSLDTPASATKP